MQSHLLGRLGLIVALATTAATCKGDPTAEGNGTPVAVQAAFASINIAIGGSGLVAASVVDVRQTPLEAAIGFATCNAAIATVAVDTGYHPVPPTSARAAVTSVQAGTGCVVVSSAGVAPDTVVVNVLKATPVVSTSRNISTGIIGATLNDTARVSGGFGTLTGTITFRLYDSKQPTCASGVRYTQALTVSGAGPYSTSPGFATDTIGTWNWTASYSGDVNNLAAASACGAEPVTITP